MNSVSVDFDGVTITLSRVNRLTGPNGITVANINIDNTTDSVQTLKIIAGANGFLGPNQRLHPDRHRLAAQATASPTSWGRSFGVTDNSLNGQGFAVDGLDLGDFDSQLSPSALHSRSRSMGLASDRLDGPYGMAKELDPHPHSRVRASSCRACR